MSAPLKTQDPLDILQLMVNDVLVQTGKALRASRKDGQGNVAQAHGSLQPKLPETIRTFHSALDDLENDIIRAKSILLRDLNELQEKKYPKEAPNSIEVPARSPAIIDLEPSPPADLNDGPSADSDAKPIAPVPDMGMGMSDAVQVEVSIQSEPDSRPSATEGTTSRPEVKASPAPMAPMPAMGESMAEQSLEEHMGATKNNDEHDMNNAELNFTDMQFTLAAPTGDSQNPSNGQEPSFDLTTFAPTDGGDEMLSFDNLLPEQPTTSVSTNAPASSLPAQSVDAALPITQEATTSDNVGKIEEKGKADTSMDDLFDLDTGPTDGLDFDFGNSPENFGEETFDSLMADRDGTYMMEHGDADTAFFGLDKME